MMHGLLSRSEEVSRDGIERALSERIELVQEHNYVSVLTVQAYRQLRAGASTVVQVQLLSPNSLRKTESFCSVLLSQGPYSAPVAGRPASLHGPPCPLLILFVNSRQLAGSSTAAFSPCSLPEPHVHAAAAVSTVPSTCERLRVWLGALLRRRGIDCLSCRSCPAVTRSSCCAVSN